MTLRGVCDFATISFLDIDCTSVPEKSAALIANMEPTLRWCVGAQHQSWGMEINGVLKRGRTGDLAAKLAARKVSGAWTRMAVGMPSPSLARWANRAAAISRSSAAQREALRFLSLVPEYRASASEFEEE